jgi:vacuolar iron transporter family protein
MGAKEKKSLGRFLTFDRFSLARRAYRQGDVEMAQAAHSDEHLNRMLREDGRRSQYLADAVLGATDGVVTTFAIVTGGAGASVSAGIILIMGCANLIADGFSMAVGNYLGGRSQQKFWQAEKEREVWEIENLPHAEREEIRQIYRQKGFNGEVLEQIVNTLTGDKEIWVDEMMREELGIQQDRIEPLTSGLVTFAAFVFGGAFPLGSYVWAFLNPTAGDAALALSIGVTGLALFGVGAARRFMMRTSWWKSGLEILMAGGIAAAAAFLVGFLLRGIIG